jgi:hypothetical protein
MPMEAKKHRLHLGLFDLFILCFAAGLVIFSVWTVLSGKGHAASCNTTGRQHILTVTNDTFPTSRLTLARCDSVKIFNDGNETYELAFGEHENHIYYPGFNNEQTLKPNEFVTFTAVQSGTYSLHDHLRDRAKIELVIE